MTPRSTRLAALVVGACALGVFVPAVTPAPSVGAARTNAASEGDAALPNGTRVREVTRSARPDDTRHATGAAEGTHGEPARRVAPVSATTPLPSVAALGGTLAPTGVSAGTASGARRAATDARRPDSRTRDARRAAASRAATPGCDAVRARDIDGDGCADDVTITPRTSGGRPVWQVTVHTARGQLADATFHTVGAYPAGGYSPDVPEYGEANGVAGREIVVHAGGRGPVDHLVVYAWSGGRLVVLPNPETRRALWRVDRRPGHEDGVLFMRPTPGTRSRAVLRMTHLAPDKAHPGTSVVRYRHYEWRGRDWVAGKPRATRVATKSDTEGVWTGLRMADWGQPD